ncbi:MAG TPA: bifunctional nuclease family protein [Anaerolineae bacterium]|nr:bifunctional nuclease family protein [Anaerolineae bacterium]HID83666.1 bifunctional nuclease family protein [Anaerolineales bacterium]HIQ08973.1 bifunctional nuclease family protein [Anaerolineaceae bacterium]
MVPVVVDSIRVSLVSPQRVVLLREKDANRYLPIWIGPFEAEAIQIALQEVEVARPLTHDLLNQVFKALGARVLRVEVVDLKENVFYGNIVAEIEGREVNIDARPSDAIALAVRAHVPIFVARHVLDAAGVVPEEDVEEESPAGEGKPTAPGPSRGAETGATAAGEGEDRLSVFEDFLEKLDLDTLDSETNEEDEGED